jgi:hypothetical protein
VADAVALLPPKQLTGVLERLRFSKALFTTVTICSQALEFPLISFTIQITDVFPIGNCKGALLVRLSMPQGSPITGGTNAAAIVSESHAGIMKVVSFGQIIDGFSLSKTLTVKLHVSDNPSESTTM